VWVVGSMSTLRASGDAHWTALLDSAQCRGLVVSASDDQRLKGRLLAAMAVNERITEGFVSSMIHGTWQVGTRSTTSVTTE
jgi:hypothetical protein